MKRIVGGLQRMIDCRDVTEGTVAWDRTHELLQMAQDGVEEEETRGILKYNQQISVFHEIYITTIHYV